MRSSKGFTLVELLVSVGLASIVMISLLSYFLTFIGQQIRAQDERAALETVRFLFTDLARELYFGQDYSCGQGSLDSCECLVFSDQLGRRVKVRRNTVTDRVEQSVKSFDPFLACSNSDAWVPLTDEAVSVSNFTFDIQENDGIKQPRILMRVTASYTPGGEDTPKTLSFKTQVTGRILAPSSDVLSTFLVDSGPERSSSITYYYVFGPRRNSAGDFVKLVNGEEVLIPEGDSPEYVCQDNQGTATCRAFCEDSIRPIAAEFTEDGLYLLGSNGLLFFIPESALGTALSATGAIGSTSVKYVKSSAVQGDVVRVVGNDGSGNMCLLCVNDPRDIVSLHPAGEYLFAVDKNGALFIVDEDLAGRVLVGNIARDRVQEISIDGRRMLLFFRAGDSNRYLRLFSGDSFVGSDSSSVENTIYGVCSEFSYVPANRSSCRQVYPHTPGGDPVEPQVELGNVSFSSIDRLQIIEQDGSAGGLMFLWYQSGNKRYLLSIGEGNMVDIKSSDGGVIDEAVVGGSAFTYSRDGGNHRFTSICRSGGTLCSLNGVNGSAAEIPVIGSPLRDHVHIGGYPVGISTSGKLVYFDGFSASSNVKEVSTYSRDRTVGDTSRVLCGLTVDGDDQVSYSHLSKKHEDKDMVALLGKSLDTEGGAVTDIYIAERSESDKDQYGVSADSSAGGELNTVCGPQGPYIERYRLPSADGPALDLVRLRGVVLRDTGSTGRTIVEPSGC